MLFRKLEAGSHRHPRQKQRRDRLLSPFAFGRSDRILNLSKTRAALCASLPIVSSLTFTFSHPMLFRKLEAGSYRHPRQKQRREQTLSPLLLVAIGQPQLNGYGQLENKAKSDGGKTVFPLALQGVSNLVSARTI